MRSFGHLLTALVLAALVLFVMPALVQCADAEQAATNADPGPAILLQAVADVPNQAAAVQQSEIAGRKTGDCALVRQDEAAAIPVISDANGCPLGSMAWFRAVWAANPPESIPGS